MVLQTILALHPRRTHIYSADEKRLELSTPGLILPMAELCHWAIHPNSCAEESNFFPPICCRALTATSASTISCWPGETRTHNSRCKRPVLWSNWVTNQFGCDCWNRTNNFYLVTIDFYHWIKPHSSDDWQNPRLPGGQGTINRYRIRIVLYQLSWVICCCGYRSRTCSYGLWDHWVTFTLNRNFCWPNRTRTGNL